MKKKLATVLFGILVVLLILSFLGPFFGRPPGGSGPTLAFNNLRQLGFACRTYAEENADQAPHAFQDLVEAKIIAAGSLERFLAKIAFDPCQGDVEYLIPNGAKFSELAEDDVIIRQVYDDRFTVVIYASCRGEILDSKK